MAYLNQQEAFEHLRDRVIEGIQSNFPVKGKTHSLVLGDVHVDDSLHPNDIHAQHEAKINGKSWAAPVHGVVSLVDNATGKTVDSKRIQLAEVPKQTSRYSYIVDGQEYQIDNQWQLKPGVYTRRRDNGELESQFNVVGRSSFDVRFDPRSKQFKIDYKKAKIPAYPILKALGVTDETLKKTWGEDVFEANRTGKRLDTAVSQFYKTSTGQTPPSKEAAEDYLHRMLGESRLSPEVTQVTLGKPFESVNGETLHLATKKLLDVQGGQPEDDRDSLVFKSLRSVGDFVKDQMKSSGRNFTTKIQRQLNSGKVNTVRDAIRFELFNEPIRFIFHKTAIANPAKQINPLEMISSAMQTTIMGPGGINSERKITQEAKMINPSHIGFLDPINTPEGEKTGVTLRLPLGVTKIGNEAKVPAMNLRTGKMEYIGPATMLTSRVALPDQISYKDGKPTANFSTVKVVGSGGAIEDVRLAEADYALRHPSQLFNLTSNLVPFLGNNSGGRAGMAARHMEQAISLVHREAPLVQVGTPVSKPGMATFEQVVGQQVAHAAPAAGVVKEVTDKHVTITDPMGKTHTVQLYNNYPLNDTKSVMHSTPLVKPGDRVKADQIVADTNYSKNGTLALGTNLRVGYVPYKGYNFEDGVVISESAAARLASGHMHKYDLERDEKLVHDVKKFDSKFAGTFRTDQYKHIGEDGVVRPGTKVRPGDPLIIAMQPYEMKDRTGLAAMRKSLTNQFTDRSVRWDSDVEGEVVGVHKTGKNISVHVRTVEPMQIGDKIAGRYGNKGIVTLILPDHEMPHDEKKKPLDVLLNPTGVPGRMNIGQVLETAVGKIAQKTGKPYMVQNFDPKVPDHLEKVKAELKQHGISDTEHLIDPITKQPLGPALVGPQYMMKLVHQVDKKLSVRSGMGLPGVQSNEGYDSLTFQPSGGGPGGGQTIGALGMYALLAHGAKANIREMQTWKSEGVDPQTDEMKKWPYVGDPSERGKAQHTQVWKAIQEGTPLPPPRSTFAFHRFTEMLKGAGINLEKKGHELILGPMTDKQILSMSAGALSAPSRAVRTKVEKSGEYQPIPGGIFDEKVTGGHGGTKWSHIPLAEPIPNPVFESAIKRLTGLSQKQYDAVVGGEQAIHPTTGKVVGLGEGTTGGAGIKLLLDKIDVPSELKKARTALSASRPADVDRNLKKVKYLQALQQLGIQKPSEAYVLHNLPVLPPVIRPLSVMQSGALRYEDVNGLYMQFAQINDKLKDPVLSANLSAKQKTTLRSDLYDGVKALMGVGPKNVDAKQKGLLEQISGTQPKEGYFQKTLMNRRQDLTMRSTIVPEPALGLDEVGLPKDAALTLFRPFVVRQLVLQGTAPTALDAQAVLAAHTKGRNDPMVWKALDQVMAERPVLLKRDPVLHRYGVQAFRAKAVDGNAIKIHPLVTGGYNADFDGDTMAAFVPVGHEAVAEARKMFPSNNLFAEASGKVMYQPTLEGALGLYKLSLVGKETSHNFATKADAAEALKSGKVQYSDVVQVGGVKTTPGRVLLANVLPPPMQHAMLTDFSKKIDKKGLDGLLSTLGRDHRHDFGRVVNDVKDLGYNASFGVVKTDLVKDGYVPIGTHSFSLDDFNADKKNRADALNAASIKAEAIKASKTIPERYKDQHIVQEYLAASKKMDEAHKSEFGDRPSNLLLMSQAGVKPSWDQYKQMVLAPVVMKDSKDNYLATPVTKSYAEGLDTAGYWTQLHGARRGAVMKVQEVREPGYMSKLLMNSAMNLLVDRKDCGTKKGVSLSIDEDDVHDRHLAADFKSGGMHLPAGTLLTTKEIGQIRSVDKNAKVLVRSALKCESDKGVCQHCVGPSITGQHHGLGTNIGILSAQAIGERAVQLTLKSFHTGGVAESGGGSKVLNSFDRFNQLTQLPTTIPNAATLAMTSGKVDRVEHGPTGVHVWIGGRAHFVGKDERGIALHEPLPNAGKIKDYKPWEPPSVGTYYEAGAPLSDPNRTWTNPHTFYEATKSMDRVQNFLTDEMHGLYKSEGIRRRAIETMVKAMSNLTKIEDPGDHPHVLRGEFYPTSVIRRMNDEELKGQRPIAHKPVLKGVDMLPLSLTEDWMAKLQHQRLKETLMDAASKGHVSNIHGAHPIPGIAYGAELGQPQLARPVPGRPFTVQPHHY